MPHVKVEVIELKCIDDEEIEDETYWYHSLQLDHPGPLGADKSGPEMPILTSRASLGIRNPIDIDDGDTVRLRPGSSILFEGGCGDVVEDNAENAHEIAGSIWLFEEDDKDAMKKFFTKSKTLEIPILPLITGAAWGVHWSLGALVLIILLPISLLTMIYDVLSTLVDAIKNLVSDKPDYLGGKTVRIPCVGPAHETRVYRFTGSSVGAKFQRRIFGSTIEWVSDYGSAEYEMKLRITRS